MSVGMGDATVAAAKVALGRAFAKVALGRAWAFAKVALGICAGAAPLQFEPWGERLMQMCMHIYIYIMHKLHIVPIPSMGAKV